MWWITPSNVTKSIKILLQNLGHPTNTHDTLRTKDFFPMCICMCLCEARTWATFLFDRAHFYYPKLIWGLVLDSLPSRLRLHFPLIYRMSCCLFPCFDVIRYTCLISFNLFNTWKISFLFTFVLNNPSRESLDSLPRRYVSRLLSFPLNCSWAWTNANEFAFRLSTRCVSKNVEKKISRSGIPNSECKTNRSLGNCEVRRRMPRLHIHDTTANHIGDGGSAPFSAYLWTWQVVRLSNINQKEQEAAEIQLSLASDVSFKKA